MKKTDTTEIRKFGITEKQFEYKGHDCLCIFTRLGYRLGYASVPESRNDEQYEDLYEDIYCHCGLSFVGPLPYEYGQKEKCYIGFDCGHICDGRDYDTAIEYGLIDETEKEEQLEAFKYLIGREIATLDYVEQQCKHIVDQLIERGVV